MVNQEMMQTPLPIIILIMILHLKMITILKQYPFKMEVLEILFGTIQMVMAYKM
jgi:hypothetical protein